MKVIGITGCKGSGKGESALQVKALFPDENVKIVGFSDKLKVLAARALGFDRNDGALIALMDSMKRGAGISILYDEPDAPVSPYEDTSVLAYLSGRQYLQEFGNNTRRLLGDEVWINAVLPPVTGPFTHQTALRQMYPDVDVLVIADVRYPNEATRIKAVDGVNWEVLRPGCEPDGHISEKPLSRGLIDWQIDNSGNLENLNHEVEIAIEGTL